MDNLQNTQIQQVNPIIAERTPIIVNRRNRTARRTDKAATNKIIGTMLIMTGGCITIGGGGSVGGIATVTDPYLLIVSGCIGLLGLCLICTGAFFICQKS